MPDQTTNELPDDIREQLPEHAQQIFAAALSAAQSNGMSEEGAREVAWNSVKNEYQPGDDGKWQRKPEDTAIHNKSVVSGGN
ncbi:ChaB family protein [Nostoc sp. FACHB-888]|uniref:ChaB family protein n=1 Tax=Nostoc sp. FACHB-888 TaxID=2692842 RepID=UPI0016867A0F|nr:ChaB family protein [Nostoc sp. FACHB-888]MBD2247200.1 ChaB family protein [Nostoc sp. FACHB-888]